jgi:hypothetical protein
VAAAVWRRLLRGQRGREAGGGRRAPREGAQPRTPAATLTDSQWNSELRRRGSTEKGRATRADIALSAAQVVEAFPDAYVHLYDKAIGASACDTVPLPGKDVCTYVKEYCSACVCSCSVCLSLTPHV